MSHTRCNEDIFHNGQPILLIDGRSTDVKRWVQALAKRSRIQVDWHLSSGVARVLFLGDQAARASLEAAIEELRPQLRGIILKVVKSGEGGLFSSGVDPAPPGWPSDPL